jgi:hypothetical protein
MCDFNNLTDEEKLHYHTILTTASNNYGGLNFFLQLVEALRDASPHPLTSRHQDFLFDLGNVRWGKTIFNDKVLLIEKLRKEKNKDGNLLKEKEGKEYKKTINLIKTLSPITFSVRPSLRDDGEGFDFKAFDKIDEETTKLNPIFEALFFCSLDTVKKILNYK